MRIVEQRTTDAWKSAFKGGDRRPVVRATIQKLNVKLCNYQRPGPGSQVVLPGGGLATVASGSSGAAGVFATAIFGQDYQPVELPNISTVKWVRAVDQDVAQMDLVLWNTERLAIGEVPEDGVSFDKPGYMTFNRGVEPTAVTRWGLSSNGWRDLLVPDRIIRTFEGYGFDPTVAPEVDTNLYPSGVWLIDDVVYNTDGTIAVSCRDLARQLLDSIFFPPVVPFAEYPFTWVPESTAPGPPIIGSATAWRRPVYNADSGAPYVGKGLTDGTIGSGPSAGLLPYVDSSGGVLGHTPRNAFDGDLTSYWLSPGDNGPIGLDHFEFLQGTVTGTVGVVKVQAWGGPYVVYVSMKSTTSIATGVNSGWIGANWVPYMAPAAGAPLRLNNGAKIPYLASFTASKEGVTTFTLPKIQIFGARFSVAYSATALWPNDIPAAASPSGSAWTGHQWTAMGYIIDATAIRFTFTSLYPSGIGAKYPYRAGVYDLQVGDVVATSTPTTIVSGNLADYTDIVKWVCAWGGFFWPDVSTGLDYLTYSDGTTANVVSNIGDPVLPTGRVWGDFENAGVNSLVPLTPDIWDKKPLMDSITYVRNILNFIFFVDETGGVVWRSPNIWAVGNFIGNGNNEEDIGRTQTSRTSSVIVIDERETLLGMQPKLSSRNIREQVFVANTDVGTTAPFGAVSPPPGSNSYNPYPSGLRRVAGYIDQHFNTQTECQIMADLIALRSMLTYRTNTLTVPGYPALQIDDQVQILERVTGESYYHYVRSITSDYDSKTGKWTYQLVTSWLGTQPGATWTFNPALMASTTQAYLRALGKI